MTDLTIDHHGGVKGIAGIGGYDIRRIAAGDAWQVWAEKTGKVQPEDLSKVLHVQLGLYLEPFIMDWFNLTWGAENGVLAETFEDAAPYLAATDRFAPFWRTHRTQRGHLITLSNEIPWALYNPDGMTFGSKRGYEDPILYEAKALNQYSKLDEAIAKYLPQVTWGMGLLKLEVCHFAVLIGTLGFEVVEIEFDPAYFAQLFDAADELWAHIAAGTEPPGRPAPAAPKAKIVGHVSYQAQTQPWANRWFDLEADYLDNEAAAKTFEAAKKDLKALVPDDAKEVVGRGIRIVRAKNGSLSFKKETRDA